MVSAVGQLVRGRPRKFLNVEIPPDVYLGVPVGHGIHRYAVVYVRMENQQPRQLWGDFQRRSRAAYRATEVGSG